MAPKPVASQCLLDRFGCRPPPGLDGQQLGEALEEPAAEMFRASGQFDIGRRAVLHDQLPARHEHATRLGEGRFVTLQVMDQRALEDDVSARRREAGGGRIALLEGEARQARRPLARVGHHLCGEIDTDDIGRAERAPGLRIDPAAAADVGDALADRIDD